MVGYCLLEHFCFYDTIHLIVQNSLHSNLSFDVVVLHKNNEKLLIKPQPDQKKHFRVRDDVTNIKVPLKI
ncbi:hypothetical protein BpHYR1_027093 [Brachionus plicatilis]|uniref:Uncharacterized protein n=1 Tax=Brachionus plicatilis TaxID=10195 RepID=A0A3M7SFS8_BRAPC|nr:hypothetical protein BpHYR1_027093 [Brachionus plicatilis]